MKLILEAICEFTSHHAAFKKGRKTVPARTTSTVRIIGSSTTLYLEGDWGAGKKIKITIEPK